MSAIEDLLNRIDLSKEINKQAQGSNRLHSLEYSQTFESFVENLVPNIDESNDDWQENYQLLDLLSELPSRLINKYNNGEKDMMTETKIAIAVGGTLLLIGLAVGVYYAKKCAKNTDNKTTKSGGRIKFNPPTMDYVMGFFTVNEDKLTPPPPPPTLHHLLLIVPAKRLPNELTEKEPIDNEQVKKIITNAVEAYCYSENDSKGNQIKLDVKYSNTDTIDYATDIMVYVHLKLHAEPSITIKPISRLSLREKISFDSIIIVEQFGKLQSSDSTLDFYEI
jgi:hypothetical protein